MPFHEQRFVGLAYVFGDSDDAVEISRLWTWRIAHEKNTEIDVDRGRRPAKKRMQREGRKEGRRGN
jgi:hypothetical protein